MSSGLILTASERSATACCATPKDLDGLSLLALAYGWHPDRKEPTLRCPGIAPGSWERKTL